MNRTITQIMARKFLYKHGVKLSNHLSDFPKNGVLEVEAGVSIGQAELGFKELFIGAYSYLRSGCEIHNVDYIGRFCSIAKDVIIGHWRAGHAKGWISTHPAVEKLQSVKNPDNVPPARIGHDVWLCRGAAILEGVSVGTGAIVGMRALVTKDVPPYAVVGGVPARIIRYRHSEPIIKGLLASRWWLYQLEELNKYPLDRPEDFISALGDSGFPAQSKAHYETFRVTRKGCELVKEHDDMV